MILKTCAMRSTNQVEFDESFIKFITFSPDCCELAMVTGKYLVLIAPWIQGEEYYASERSKFINSLADTDQHRPFQLTPIGENDYKIKIKHSIDGENYTYEMNFSTDNSGELRSIENSLSTGISMGVGLSTDGRFLHSGNIDCFTKSEQLTAREQEQLLEYQNVYVLPPRNLFKYEEPKESCTYMRTYIGMAWDGYDIVFDPYVSYDDLDECNGKICTDGVYRYFVQNEYPYFVGCFRGSNFELPEYVQAMESCHHKKESETYHEEAGDHERSISDLVSIENGKIATFVKHAYEKISVLLEDKESKSKSIGKYFLNLNKATQNYCHNHGVVDKA